MKLKFIKLKSLLALAVVGAITLSSCSKEDALAEKESPETDINSRLAKITITAFNGEEEPASKTVLAGDELKQVHWTGVEKIAVFYKDASNKPNEFTSNDESQRATTTFEGTIEGIDNVSKLAGKEVIGLYPYNANATISADGTISTTLPDVQEAVPNSFASNLMITMGKSTSNATKMKFFNVCGGLCFTVQNEDIKQVVLTAKGGEKIAGDFTVKFEEVDGKELPIVQNVSNGKSSITINAPDGKTFAKETRYYIVTLPVKEFSQGITITCVKSDSADENSSNGDGERTYHNGHEYVDLGLESGLKWATTNVGADNPRDYGDYFAWGETNTKTDYSWSTYSLSNNGSSSSFKRYTGSDYSVLKPEDDAACFNWQGSWRMPTQKEWSELYDSCQWDWIDKEILEITGKEFKRSVFGLKKVVDNDANAVTVKLIGYKVTSNTNGNSIFLPAAGGRDGTSAYDQGSYGYYWSSSLLTDYPVRAWYLYFGSSSVFPDIRDYRYYGQSVRPVLE